MNKNYLLSIIIPTKNRESYAIKAIEQVLKINDEKLQVVIQDNSDTDKLFHMLINDDRIKYNHTNEVLSFVDNFNLAVELADGEYVCIIGDDDGVLPHIIDVVKWAKENSVGAIKPGLSIIYYWPNSMALSNEDKGCLILNKISLKTRFVTPYNEVKKLLGQGSLEYLSLDLVKLYHGIVRREYLLTIKHKTGKYFGGLSPDIYISVALSLTVPQLFSIDIPLTISGICDKSGSSDSASGKHTGRLEEAPHFHGHERYGWSELVPKFYSVETIWADSSLAALKDLNQTKMLEKFNIIFFVTNCLIKYPQFKKVLMEHYIEGCNKDVFSIIKLYFTYIQYKAVNFLKSFKRRYIRMSPVYTVNEIENIVIAGELVQHKLGDLGLDQKEIVKLLDKIILEK